MEKQLSKKQIREDAERASEWWFNYVDKEGCSDVGFACEELMEHVSKGDLVLANDYTPEQLEVFCDWVDRGVSCKFDELSEEVDSDPREYGRCISTAVTKVYNLL